MKNPSHKAIIVYLTTFPPRECGIATFTADLTTHFDKMYGGKEDTKIIAMNIDASQARHYPSKVIAEVEQDDPNDYEKAAELINQMSDVALVAVEHEYGIYGKGFGKNLLVFLSKVMKPVSVTCHTVLPNPPEEMKRVMSHILARADVVIVMTETSKRILGDIYGADLGKVKVIPHGIHPASYTDGHAAKRKLGLTGKRVISTFGFLSRGKGIEYGIEAMPQIVKRFPNTLYLVIGETHPVVRQKEGESYRKSLIAEAKKLGVEEHVRFYNEYLKTEDLLTFLEATDVYLSLSQNTDQAVSGTLSYALGAGRPIVATPFSQAKEIITPEVGVLVTIGASKPIAREVLELLGDERRRVALGKNAYFRTRIMTWPNVALSYMREFTGIAPALGKKERVLPKLTISHLKHLTDDFGVFQFAILNNSDPKWGYTLDDNARALAAMAWCANQKKDRQTSAKLARIYLRFIERAIREQGGFHNYFTSDHKPHDELNQSENLEDTFARALWALAEAARGRLPWLLRRRASSLFKKQLDHLGASSSPRAAGFIIKACASWLTHTEDSRARGLVEKQADFLVDIFERTEHSSWQWFEDILAYSNGVMPEALLIAYELTKNEKYLKVAKASLNFLIAQSFDGGVLSPVGHAGWYRRGDKKHLYDQQPEEVSALVLALRSMARITGDVFYTERMIEAFNWFVGNNVLHQMVYSETTGGCYDGISEKEVNLNQGAESTVSYLLARLSMEGKVSLRSDLGT